MTDDADGDRAVPRDSRATHSRLRITLAHDENKMLVALDGELDAHTVAEARVSLDQAIARASTHNLARVVVDAGGLTFCDSTGLSALVRASDAAKARGVRIALRALSPQMRELLRITGLDALVEPGDI